MEALESVEFIRREGADPNQLGDYLVAHLCKKAGCERTVTFDRQAANSVPGMELLA